MTARWLAVCVVMVVGCGKWDYERRAPVVHDVCVESVVGESFTSTNGGPWRSDGFTFAGEPGDCLLWAITWNEMRCVR